LSKYYVYNKVIMFDISYQIHKKKDSQTLSVKYRKTIGKVNIKKRNLEVGKKK